MKRIFPLLFLLPAALFAAEVSPKDAARAAQAWVDRGYAMGKLPVGRAVAAVDEVEDPVTGARLLVAKFAGGGYVVLSADDLVDPVIAFSETGDGIDLDDNNPLWALLRGDIAAREAAAGVVRGAATALAPDIAEGEGGAPQAAPAAPTSAQKKWADLLSGRDVLPEGTGVNVDDDSHALQSISDVRVDSFVDSRWNQKTASAYSGTTDYCYNYYTPNHYYSGCVATAISQMMWYFRHPTASVAASTYPCKVDGVATNTTMMGGVYDWANMPARPWVSGVTEAQRAAIGKLVYDVGVTVGMNWKSGSSSASIYVGQTALKEDFGYAQAVALAYQNDSPYDYYPWSLDTFKQVVIPCLDARTPVGLSISRPSGGHAVFADGYGYSSGDFYLHVNFGWGYSADTQTAWYCPPDLNTNNYDYDTIKGILCNIFPDRTGNIFSGRVTGTDGLPIANATVTFSDGQTTTTDSNGIYAFVAQPGSYTATASKGSASQSVSGSLTETVALKTSGRTSSFSYTRNKCGNSGGNDIVLNVSQDTAPTISSAAASDVSFTSAKIVVAVSDLGLNSTSVEVKAVVGGTTKTQTLNASGTATLSFTGLSAGTQYTATVTVTGSNRLSSTRTVTFSTTAYTAPTLGTVSLSATTASVTLTVPVTALGAGATSVSVSATLGDATKTATVSAAGGTATLSFDGLVPDSSYPWTVVATGVPTGKTADAAGTAATEALPAVGWFDVKWASDGYGTGMAWWNAAAERTSGGRWTRPAGDASSRGGSALALALPEGGELRFTAVSPSAAGGYVTVDGTLSPVLSAALPEVPAGALAALCFARGGYKAWNGAEWVALSGAAPAASATAWTATFDFASSSPRVRYAVGGEALSASGSEWIPLAFAPGFVRGVGYAGGGELGDFKATCAGGFFAPVFSTAGEGGAATLVFGGTDANPVLWVSVANARAGVWYTAFTASCITNEFRAEYSTNSPADGLLSIPVDAREPTRFIRVKASSVGPIPSGEPL